MDGELFNDQNVLDGEPNRYRPDRYFGNHPQGKVGINPGGTAANNGEDGDWYLYASRIPNLMMITCGHDVSPWPIGFSTTSQQTVMIGEAGNTVLCIYANKQDRDDNPIDTELDAYCLMAMFQKDGTVRTWGLNTWTGEVNEDLNDEQTTAIMRPIPERVRVRMALAGGAPLGRRYR